MSILLPVTDYLDAQPGMMDWGGALVPVLGGPEQRVNRLGTRCTLAITTDPDGEANARLLLQRLLQGMSQGVKMLWPQSGLKVGVPGSPQVDGAVAGGTSIPLKGLTPHYAVRVGQPLSLLIGGRLYLHFADDQVIADGGGRGTVVVTPMLRKPLVGDEAVEIARPMIEGALAGDAMQWNIAANGAQPFQFTIREMA